MEGINPNSPSFTDPAAESAVPEDELIFNPLPEEQGCILEPPVYEPPIDWCGTGTGEPVWPSPLLEPPNIDPPWLEGTITNAFGNADSFGGPGPEVVINPAPEGNPDIGNILAGLVDGNSNGSLSLTPNGLRPFGER